MGRYLPGAWWGSKECLGLVDKVASKVVYCNLQMSSVKSIFASGGVSPRTLVLHSLSKVVVTYVVSSRLFFLVACRHCILAHA